MEETKEELKVETRTLEKLLKDLREEKQWTYMHIVQELNTLGILVDEKTVKKWEIGLEYPELNEIYKLSELYFIPSENLIMAKSNSYEEGLASIHATLIKWVCYVTGISLKIGYIGFYVIITLAMIGALLFFVGKINDVVELGKENI